MDIVAEDLRSVICSDDGRRLELVFHYRDEDGEDVWEPFTIRVSGHNLEGIAFALRLGDNPTMDARPCRHLRDSAAPFVSSIEGLDGTH